jgi:tetratricopeptide (TPR) repeat protein
MSEGYETEEPTMAELWERATEENEYETRTNALVTLAVRLRTKGEYWKSMASAQTALDLFQKAGDQYQVGCSYMHIGECHYLLDNHTDAIEQYSIAADIFQSIANDSARGEALGNLGMSHAAAGNEGEAILAWRNAIEIQISAGDHGKAGRTAIDLGEMLGGKSRQKEALSAFKEALEHFQEANDIFGTVRANDRIAAALIDLGEMTEAVDRLKEALALADYMELGARVAYQKYRLGWTYVLMNRYAEAIPLLEEAAAAQKEVGNFAASAESDLQRGHALRGLGRGEEALELYKTVRAVFQGVNQKSMVANTDLTIGYYLSTQDKLLEAEHPLLSALSIGNELNDLWLQRVARIHLAELYLEREQPAEALAMLSKYEADDWAQDTYRKACYISAKAKALVQLGNISEGRELARQVIDLHATQTMPQEAAEAYELLVVTGDGEDPAELDRLTAMAIANYLAADETAEAVRLSKRMLPKRGEAPYLSRGRDYEQPTLFDEVITQGPAK